MAKRITDLPELPTADAGDLLPVVDLSGNITKRVPVSGTAAVVAANIPDGALPYRTTDGKTWWEEIGRTTLAAKSTTIDVLNLPARKYLKVLIAARTDGGVIRCLMRFNGDAGTSYSVRYLFNNSGSTSALGQGALFLSPAETSDQIIEANIVNIANREKPVLGSGMTTGSLGGTPTSIDTGFGKWTNASALIQNIRILTDNAGQFDAGSEVIVLGHN